MGLKDAGQIERKLARVSGLEGRNVAFYRELFGTISVGTRRGRRWIVLYGMEKC